MLIIVDQRLPEQAKKQLEKEGEILEMHSSGITYSNISGHPDIFICQTPQISVIAPNTPEHVLNGLDNHHISYVYGNKKVGEVYPSTAVYNAVVTEKHLIHRTDITDKMLKQLTGHKTSINIHQGYTRCNLVPVNNNVFISCDGQITGTLRAHGAEVLYLRTTDVLLPGFKYGFFGGACGFNDNRLYVAGSLKYFTDSVILLEFARKHGFDIVELYNGPLYDGGSILFFE